MINLSKTEIIDKIQHSTQMQKTEIEDRISKKMTALSNLISEQGAAYIVANELGVSLNAISEDGFMKIKQISTDMKNVSIFARVISVQAIREYQKNGIPSKVGNVLIADETGECRLVIWDSRISKFENGEINSGDIIKATSCYAKDNPYSGIELHVRDRSVLEVNPKDAPNIPIVNTGSTNFKILRTNIANIVENTTVEVIATIVQLFMQRPFYEVCPNCAARLVKQENSFSCRQHGITEPAYKMFISVILDDGTGNIRATMFGKEAESLVGISSMGAYELSRKNADELFILRDSEHNLLGKQVKIIGNAKLNTYSGNIEITVNRLDMNINLLEEIRKPDIKAQPKSERAEHSSSIFEEFI